MIKVVPPPVSKVPGTATVPQEWVLQSGCMLSESKGTSEEVPILTYSPDVCLVDVIDSCRAVAWMKYLHEAVPVDVREMVTQLGRRCNFDCIIELLGQCQRIQLSAPGRIMGGELARPMSSPC